jgi:hypothetical protein
MSNPNRLGGNIKNTSVLFLCRRKSDGRLLLAIPSNETRSKMEDIARDGLAVIKITNPIGVSITYYIFIKI